MGFGIFEHIVMGNRVKCIFIYICIFSVFSLTLQSSVVSLCKESKVFKGQSQANPVTEEEEGSQDADESADEEVLYLSQHSLIHSSQNLLKHSWARLKINYPFNSITILVPPPKF